MTREQEYEAALEQVRREAVARYREAQASRFPERRAPAPVIRDELDAAFAALRAREARP